MTPMISAPAIGTATEATPSVWLASDTWVNAKRWK